MYRYLLQLLLIIIFIGCSNSSNSQNKENWINKPQNEWPQVSMINSIEYQDKSFPVAGCGGRCNCDATFFFLFHPIHFGRAVVDLAHFVRAAGVI